MNAIILIVEFIATVMVYSIIVDWFVGEHTANKRKVNEYEVRRLTKDYIIRKAKERGYTNLETKELISEIKRLKIVDLN